MQGELTSPIDPKPGCRFAGRCPYATEECRKADIPLVKVGPDHEVACLHPME
jgi:oligopeptide/dipeptide ABC transporter ATP-binding protein